MTWFDSHCHLHLCEAAEPVEDVVQRAARAGVVGMLTLGTDVASSRRAAELASRDSVWAAAGIHPTNAVEWTDEAASEIEMLLARREVVAVGESGLDYFRQEASSEGQERAFADHIALAKKFGKALVIHTRDSVDAALDYLEKSGPPDRLVFHCWSGDASQMERALGLGAYISFAGNVSYKKSNALRALLPLVPRERLLIETDAPFLAPEGHRGKSNEPALVTFVGAAVARARGESPEDVAVSSSANARALFDLN